MRFLLLAIALVVPLSLPVAARAEDRHSALKMLDEPCIAGDRISSVSLSPDGRFVAGIEHG